MREGVIEGIVRIEGRGACIHRRLAAKKIELEDVVAEVVSEQAWLR